MTVFWALLLLGVFVAGWVSSAVATWVAIRLAPRLGLIDRPTERKNHAQPTPVVGGLAFVGSFLVICGLATAVVAVMTFALPRPQQPTPSDPGATRAAWHAAIQQNYPGQMGQALAYVANAYEQLPQVAAICGAVLVLLVIGVIDDRLPLPAWPKLIVQIAAATLAVIAGGVHLTLFLPVWIGVPLTIAWCVAVINAINFLDNMDALAGGIAVWICTALLAVGLTNGQLFVPAFAALLMGCVLGFLRFNVAPARVFMGDAGALPLGLLLALLSVLTTYYEPTRQHATRAAVLTPVLLLAVPLYDTATTLLGRWREGRPLMQADRTHFSHRLVALGFTRVQAVRIVWLLTAVCGLSAVVLQWLPGHAAALAVTQVMLVLIVVRLLERRDAAARAHRSA